MISESLRNVFECKIVSIGDLQSKYSAALNFFEFQTEFAVKPTEPIRFTCIICNKVYSERLGATSNLNKHLEDHQCLENWIESYSKLKFFLTSNTAIQQLKNPFLRSILTVPLPHPHKFAKSILPQVRKTLKINLERKLKDAHSICLIIDLWSGQNMEHFLAVATCLMYKSFSREIRVIGMRKMPRHASAETIKDSLEHVINHFEFDKTKITGVVCDQSSSLVRLFKQNQNVMFDDAIEELDLNMNGFREVEDAELEFDQSNEIDDQNDLNELNQRANSRSLVCSFEDVDIEIDRVVEEPVPFFDEILINQRLEDEQIQEDVDDDNENDYLDPIFNLNLKIGSETVPRYSCSSHKINLGVRTAIKKCKFLSRNLVKLSNYAGSVRSSTVLSYDFRLKEAKLRCENGTRWSSTYLMLESFYSAYEKNLLKENECPISRAKLVNYLKILNPLYLLSLLSQKSDWHIGDLIPSLIVIINATLSEYNEQGECKKLVEELIKELNKRFEYEFNSSIYLLAALLNISKLDFWYNKPYAIEITEKAIDHFSEAALFLYSDKNPSTEVPRANNESQRSNPAFNCAENRVLRSLIKSRA
ncbi:zinc finger BED domain-containing DAYSLEEPER-like [Brachionus plicatilis]|uniref:Zinc finger BED domain-containing DAYSLEEPER-like n=1 Tax=Brachionus plicatilis TaxID=10195 RepID=A0A3M7PNE5_BRAPC|nr:zinc finger BED domain-containing DAYSLEEPER-like [Brachionus plicatilis]